MFAGGACSRDHTRLYPAARPCRVSGPRVHMSTLDMNRGLTSGKDCKLKVQLFYSFRGAENGCWMAVLALHLEIPVVSTLFNMV